MFEGRTAKIMVGENDTPEEVAIRLKNALGIPVDTVEGIK